MQRTVIFHSPIISRVLRLDSTSRIFMNFPSFFLRKKAISTKISTSSLWASLGSDPGQARRIWGSPPQAPVLWCQCPGKTHGNTHGNGIYTIYHLSLSKNTHTHIYIYNYIFLYDYVYTYIYIWVDLGYTSGYCWISILGMMLGTFRG